MERQGEVQLLRSAQTGADAARCLGEYRSGAYQEEAKAFFRNCVGEEIYARAMNSEAGRRHHYVAARAFLNQTDWEKFVWIEEHGSLNGFPGQL